jgi:nucleoside-diphosphate-sugar epimerase
MKVLITGGRGFIGKRLVVGLSKGGCQIDVLSRSEVDSLALKECSASFLKVDLLDLAFNFDNLVGEYDVIFNCAGELLNESLMYPLHFEATARMIDSCKKKAHAQKRIIHWVQLSSVGAYGPSQPNPNTERVVTEETILAPIGEYEVTKTLADEMIVKAADEFFSYTILRPSNVYGADMPNNSIRQLAAMVKRGLFFYIGKHGACANYVHVEDVVDALILCGFDSRARGQIFNLSNDCDQSVVINALAEAKSVSPPTVRINEYFVRIIAFVFSWLPKFPLKKSRIDALVSRTHYDISKIKRVLEFKPSRDVKKTIVEILK